MTHRSEKYINERSMLSGIVLCFVRFAIAAAMLLQSGCGSGGGRGDMPVVALPPPPSPPTSTPPTDTVNYTVLTERTLDADGDQVGLDTYDLIRDFGGPNPIEAPDL